jgi:hypothetical protein
VEYGNRTGNGSVEKNGVSKEEDTVKEAAGESVKGNTDKKGVGRSADKDNRAEADAKVKEAEYPAGSCLGTKVAGPDEEDIDVAEILKMLTEETERN